MYHHAIFFSGFEKTSQNTPVWLHYPSDITHINQLCVSHLPHPLQLEVVFELLLLLPQVSPNNDQQQKDEARKLL